MTNALKKVTLIKRQLNLIILVIITLVLRDEMTIPSRDEVTVYCHNIYCGNFDA